MVTWTMKVPVVCGTPKISASPGVNVVPSPKRIDNPEGNPVALQVNGALPPLLANSQRLQGTPSVQSSQSVVYGEMFATVGCVPTRTMVIVFE